MGERKTSEGHNWTPFIQQACFPPPAHLEQDYITPPVAARIVPQRAAAVFALLSALLVTQLMTANEKPPPAHHFHKHAWTHQL